MTPSKTPHEEDAVGKYLAVSTDCEIGVMTPVRTPLPRSRLALAAKRALPLAATLMFLVAVVAFGIHHVIGKSVVLKHRASSTMEQDSLAGVGMVGIPSVSLSARSPLVMGTEADGSSSGLPASKALPAIKPWGFDLSGRNLSASPSESFYDYAGGSYIAALEIPEDKSSWGPFSILSEAALKQVKQILDDNEAIGGKAGRFYRSFMNMNRVEELGPAPLAPSLTLVRELQDAAGFARLVGKAVSGKLPSPFSIGIDADARNPAAYCVSIDQSGLGLPRDYYLKDSFADQRAAYIRYIEKMLRLVKWEDPQGASAEIFAFERSIAKVSWSPTAMRDPIKNYNAMHASALQARAPGFNWVEFLGESGPFADDTKFVVGAIGGVIGIADILGKSDLAVLKSWLAFHLADNAASVLPSVFVDAAFEFNKVLSGAKTLSPRWKRGVRLLNAHMGEEVGRKYVEKHFPPTSKQQVQLLISNLKDAFGLRIKRLDWMTSPTKEKALTKLSAFDAQVGYPKKFQSYENLTVDEADLYGNVERAIAFDWAIQLARLGKPVDRDIWDMTPQTVNAYFDPLKTQIVLPAAILQPPFFDPHADMAVNYGAIGAVIGHEMTHGFDDQGRQYDGKGQLSNWWTPADERQFMARAKRYGEQFANFDLGLADAHINPDLTIGENIADLGGLTLALDAYHAYRASAGGSSDGELEEDRRLFFGFSQVWREKVRDETAKLDLVSDPHSPPKARTDVPVSNLAAWARAFGVTQGGGLARAEADRVKIW